MEFAPQLYVEPIIPWNRTELPWRAEREPRDHQRHVHADAPRVRVGLLQYQSRNDAISTDAHFRWEYIPGSELFVVYSYGRTTLSRGIPDIYNAPSSSRSRAFSRSSFRVYHPGATPDSTRPDGGDA